MKNWRWITLNIGMMFNIVIILNIADNIKYCYPLPVQFFIRVLIWILLLNFSRTHIFGYQLHLEKEFFRAGFVNNANEQFRSLYRIIVEMLALKFHRFSQILIFRCAFDNTLSLFKMESSQTLWFAYLSLFTEIEMVFRLHEPRDVEINRLFRLSLN